MMKGIQPYIATENTSSPTHRGLKLIWTVLSCAIVLLICSTQIVPFDLLLDDVDTTELVDHKDNQEETDSEEEEKDREEYTIDTFNSPTFLSNSTQPYHSNTHQTLASPYLEKLTPPPDCF